MLIIVFIICLAASVVGTIVGAGGGVIIKPVLDMLSVMPVKTLSFCSGCTVLVMAVTSVFRSMNSGIRLESEIIVPLGTGAAAGGIAGKLILNMLGSTDGLLGAVQSFCMIVLMAAVLIYLCVKTKIKPKKIKNFWLVLTIGIAMGAISTFLGIGGGPINMAVLFFFFSMEAKQAALNSLCLIVFSQAASLGLSFATNSIPEFSWIYLLGMISGGVGGALIGNCIAKRITNRNTEALLKTLTAVIVLISSYNAVSYLT